MLTGKKYEDVIANVSASLKEKIEHSVSLLRKAEKLALIYDNTNGFMLAFSGGKDSQALFHIAELAGVKFKAHMNLTSVDPPEVIRFVKQYYPEVYLAKPYDSIFNIAVKKGILPTMRVRFCCKELKESTGAGKVTLIGIRHAESIRRAKRNEVEISSHKYSGTLDGLDEYRRKKRGPGRPRKNPKPEPFNINTVKGESQAGCISGKESLLISPIIHWEERDVWDFLDIMGVPHCSLYDEGWKRLGCIGCPMSSPKMKLRENERWPHVRRNWIKAIIRIRRGGGITRRTYQPQDQPRNLDGRLPRKFGGGGTDVQNPRPMDAGRKKLAEGYLWWGIREDHTTDWQHHAGNGGKMLGRYISNRGSRVTRTSTRTLRNGILQQADWGGY